MHKEQRPHSRTLRCSSSDSAKWQTDTYSFGVRTKSWLSDGVEPWRRRSCGSALVPLWVPLLFHTSWGGGLSWQLSPFHLSLVWSMPQHRGQAISTQSHVLIALIKMSSVYPSWAIALVHLSSLHSPPRPTRGQKQQELEVMGEEGEMKQTQQWRESSGALDESSVSSAIFLSQEHGSFQEAVRRCRGFQHPQKRSTAGFGSLPVHVQCDSTQ